MLTEEQIGEFGLTRVLDASRAARTAICEETARITSMQYSKALRAVVLTGSLARHEATFVEDGAGLTLLGDADFFLVFSKSAKIPGSSELNVIKAEVEQNLRDMRLRVAVGLAAVNETYFRQLPYHVSPYELRCCGCVAWGDATVLDLIPKFTPQQICREDAWRLLANRIVELLEAIALSPEKVHYCATKLYLDMATSYLLFAGRYVPTYRGRERELSALAKDSQARIAAPFPIEEFAEKVRVCTRFKLEAGVLAISEAELLHDAIRFAKSLWIWELQQLTGEICQDSSVELMSRWMAQQPLRARIRGWLSVLRRCGWKRSRPHWLRWLTLGRQASPRYWIYHVAVSLFFQLSRLERQELELNLQQLASRLPVLNGQASNPAQEGWRGLAQLTALNYHRLLETTTS